MLFRVKDFHFLRDGRMTLKCFLLVWILIVIIPIGIMNVVSSEEPWSEEIKLYENAGLGDLEVFQDKLFVVGSDDRGELFYKVYNGTRWSNMIQITFDDFPDVHPDAAVFNDRLYMTWHSKRDGQYAWDVYLMTFDGMDWTTPQRLTNNPGVDDHSSLTSYNDKLWLFWASDMEGSFGIYYMIFNGSEWSSPRRLADGLHPSSAVFRDKLYVAWYSGAYVYIKFYDGYSWSEEIPVATEWVMATTGLGVFNDTLYLLYASDRDGNWELYYKTFNGICWSDNVRVTYNPAKDGWGHLVSYQNRAYLMWQRMTDSHTEVFYKETENSLPLNYGNWSLVWEYKANHVIKKVSISPDGNYILAVGDNYDVWRNDVLYLLAINGSLIWKKDSATLFGERDWIHEVSACENASYIVVGSEGKTFLFRKDGSLVWEKEGLKGMNRVAISNDGEYIAVGTYPIGIGWVYLFNKQGKQLWNFTTVGDVTSISISRKGNFIVVGDDKGYVYLLDKNGTLLWDKKIVEVNCDAIYVSISADGKNIGVGMQIHYEYDKIGILTQEGKWLLSPTQVEHLVVGISIASNEDYIFLLVPAENDGLFIYSSNGKIYSSFKARERVLDVDNTPEGINVVVGSDDLRVYHLENPVIPEFSSLSLLLLILTVSLLTLRWRMQKNIQK